MFNCLFGGAVLSFPDILTACLNLSLHLLCEERLGEIKEAMMYCSSDSGGGRIRYMNRNKNSAEIEMRARKKPEKQRL